MRYMMIFKPADSTHIEAGVPPTQEEFEKMGELIEEMADAGVLIATDGLLPSALGARVRRADGSYSVTDGPFAETKELIAGFAIVDVDSKETAVDLAKRFLAIAGDGVSEIRQMHPEPAFSR